MSAEVPVMANPEYEQLLENLRLLHLSSLVPVLEARLKRAAKARSATRTSWPGSSVKRSRCAPNAPASAASPPVTSPSSAASRSSTGRLSLPRSEEHTSELQSRPHIVCRLLL